MEKNIFENAYRSKRYITRDNRIAVFLSKANYGFRPYCLVIENTNEQLVWYDEQGNSTNTSSNVDIVSEWQEPIICKCEWKDYYCYHIMLPDGIGHVRVSFFKDEIVISDLFVSENHRQKGYATILLDKVDEILAGRKANIVPLEHWTEEWYKRRGYNIINENE